LAVYACALKKVIFVQNKLRTTFLLKTRNQGIDKTNVRFCGKNVNYFYILLAVRNTNQQILQRK